MTIEEKITARMAACYKNFNRKPTGLVVDQETYNYLLDLNTSTSFSDIIKLEYMIDLRGGDRYRGLEVSISRREGALIVY